MALKLVSVGSVPLDTLVCPAGAQTRLKIPWNLSADAAELDVGDDVEITCISDDIVLELRERGKASELLEPGDTMALAAGCLLEVLPAIDLAHQPQPEAGKFVYRVGKAKRPSDVSAQSAPAGGAGEAEEDAGAAAPAAGAAAAAPAAAAEEQASVATALALAMATATSPPVGAAANGLSPADVEAALADCKSMVEAARAALLDRADGPLATEHRTCAWKDELDALSKRCDAGRVMIAVVGDTGAGKSSLLNALLGEEDLLPTSSMQACTAAVVEISHAAQSQYTAVIEFLTKDEWQLRVQSMWTDLQVSGSVAAHACAHAYAHAHCTALRSWERDHESHHCLVSTFKGQNVSV